MNDVRELSRHASPGGRPQPVAFHRGTLWIGSRERSRLYAIDPLTWSVREEVAIPGEPFGLASFDGALHVIVSIGEDDDRYLYRYVPGTTFDPSSGAACPERTGSNLASDGTALYLVQATFGKIVKLDGSGSFSGEITLGTRCAGLAFGAGGASMIAADDEFDVLQFGSLDLAGSAAAFTPIAGISADARGLAFDGKSWWTNLREKHEIISFASPAA